MNATAVNAAARELVARHGLAPATEEGVRLGLENGYPECCIVFFVTSWLPRVLAFLDAEATAETDALMAEHSRLLLAIPPEIGHIPCPDCLAAWRASHAPKPTRKTKWK